ncbi:MAG: DUF4358 domain-containing protein [Clostridia bacterium]|nr:DUF4358 domain-containing protein [Clostridia bacterium]
MKKLILLITVTLALLLVSCSTVEIKEESTVTPSDYSVQETLDSLLASGHYSVIPIVYQNGSERELDEDYLDYYFGNADLLEGIDSYIFVTSPNTNVNEMGVFKITDAKNREMLIEAFNTRRENLIQTHTNYSAEDLAIAENMIIADFDDIVYFIATPDNAFVEEIVKG